MSPPNGPGLKTFRSSQCDGGEAASVDVVVIQGLGATPWKPWEDGQWVSSVLERLESHVRLSFYTYDARDCVVGLLAGKRAEYEAGRLLDVLVELRRADETKPCQTVFVVGDLGYLLLQQALLGQKGQEETGKEIIMSIESICVISDNPDLFDKLHGAPLFAGCLDVISRREDILPITRPGVVAALSDWVHKMRFAEGGTKLLEAIDVWFTAKTQGLIEEDGGWFVSLYSALLADFLRTLPEPLDADAGRLCREFRSRVPSWSNDIAKNVFSRESHNPKLQSVKSLKSWVSSQTSSLLLIHAPSRPVETAVLLSAHVGSLTNDEIQRSYFVFDSAEHRRESIDGMLCSNIASLIASSRSGQARAAVAKALRVLDLCRRQQPEDLFAVWSSIVLELMVQARSRDHPMMHFLWLADVDASSAGGGWLCHKIQEIATGCELLFRIAITSTVPGANLSVDDSAIEKSIDLELAPAFQEAPQSTGEKGPSLWDIIPPDLADLVQTRPQLHDNRAAVERLLNSCDEDSKLRRMIATWLRFAKLPTGAALDDLLTENTPASPERIFSLIVASIPPPAQKLATRMLTHLLFAFEPPSPAELYNVWSLTEAERPAVSDASFPLDTPQGIVDNTVCGLIVHNDGELSLGHPLLRSYLLHLPVDIPITWWGVVSEKSSHQQIADTCLACLQSYLGRRILAWSTSDRRHNLVGYAVKYWLSHARYGNFEGELHGVCSKAFLQDTELVEQWAKHYVAVVSPSTPIPMPPLPQNRASSQVAGPCPADAMQGVEASSAAWWTQTSKKPQAQGYGASLAIFAENGAAELLQTAMQIYSQCGGKDDFQVAVLGALVGSAAKGHLEVVQGLLSEPCLEGVVWDEPVMAAIEGGNPSVLSELLDRVAAGRGKVTPLCRSALVTRAASLGNLANVQELIKHSFEFSAADPPLGLQPLHHACQRGFSDVARALICSGVDVFATDEEGQTAHYLAVKHGRSEIVKLLVEAETTAGWDGRSFGPESYYADVGQTAYRFGQYKALDILLSSLIEHNPDFHFFELKKWDSWSGSPECTYVLRHHRNLWGPSSYEATRDLAIAEVQVRELASFTQWTKRGIDAQSLAHFLELAMDTGDLETMESVLNIAGESPWMTEEIMRSTATGALGPAIKESSWTGFVPCLIAKGADITSRSVEGRTPLFYAAWHRNPGALEALIDAGADVNASGDGNWQPLHIAYDSAEIAAMLIKGGADVDAKTVGTKATALALAAKWDQLEVVRTLLKSNPSRETVQVSLDMVMLCLEALTARSTAGTEGDSRPNTGDEVIETLLDSCPDPSYVIDPGRLLLSLVQHSRVRATERLLSFPVKVNHQDMMGRAPLHLASDIRIAKMLVRRGAAIEMETHAKETPICCAIRRRNAEMVGYLIDRGAKLDTTTGPDRGPLLAACRHGTVGIVRLLLESKAGPPDVNHVDAVAGTALQTALRRGCRDGESAALVSYLVTEAEADVNLPSASWGGPLHVASLTCPVEQMSLLIDKGADVGRRDHVGRTPLHLALYQSLDHVTLLCDRHGADLDAVDDLGRHALHYAVAGGSYKVVLYVLARRPELADRADKRGWTPLLWAMRLCDLWGAPREAERREKSRLLIMKRLVGRRHRASRLVRGDALDGKWTPLLVAKFYDMPDQIVRLVTPSQLELMTDEGTSYSWMNDLAKKGERDQGAAYCDACLMPHFEAYYECTECPHRPSLCTICCHAKETIHPFPHMWDLRDQTDEMSELADSYSSDSDD